MPVQPRIYDIPPMAPINDHVEPSPELVELFARPQRIAVDTDRGSWVHDTFMMHAAMLDQQDPTPTDPDFTPDNPQWEDFHR
jgi:hypothetical protein